ncbi:MAG: replication initiator [Acidimicrobiales bacterium]
MNPAERANLLREVEQAGNCSHPIRLRGESVNLATGEVGESLLRVACKDRRDVVCASCSYLYKLDAWILVSSGLVGGKGIPELVGTHPRLFVTTTAPSFGAVHTVAANGSCVRRRRVDSPWCSHGRLSSCSQYHHEEDSQLGRPLCVDCFDYEGAVLWNAHASRLWNNTVQQIRRSLAEAGGLVQTNLKEVAQLHYLKVAEVQRRGLIHIHSVIRVDGPESIDVDPPDWLTPGLLSKVIRGSVERASATRLDGKAVRWGRMLDIRDLGLGVDDARKVASYVAKYSTKTTDGSRDLARRFHSRRQIEELVDNSHFRRLALKAWDLAARPAFEPLNLKIHAHAFGYTGQLITKSREYSTTFAALRRARIEYMSSRRIEDPIEGTFHFEGRGYDDPRAVELAEVFFIMQKELREEAMATRLAHKGAI